MKKYKLRINWGSTSFGEEQVKTYEFDTEKEMDAFLLGVDESNGWLIRIVTNVTKLKGK